MKKITKPIFALLFAFAFLFFGTANIKAEEAKELEVLHNTNVSNYNFSYKVEQADYYAIVGDSQGKSLILSSKKISEGVGLLQSYYSAQVSVVKCSESKFYDGKEMCLTWTGYNYSDNPEETMDALAQMKPLFGDQKILNLSFEASRFEKTPSENSVNGATLGKLDSIYSLKNTYFVIVQYELNSLFNPKYYQPEIFRVVFTDDLAKTNIITNTTEGKTQVTITSGTPIDKVRYFHTSSKLTEGFNFEEKYTASETGVVALEKVLENPKCENGLCTYTFELSKEEGEYYYVEATDLGGTSVVKDVSSDSQVENVGNKAPQSPEGNVSNTNVGKIIIISLIAVLVIAIVLVIVQRIIDYRKKLY